MIYRTALLSLFSVLTCLVYFSTAQADDKNAEDKSIVTTELDKLGLAVKMRPILPEITTGDPLRFAVHFEKKTGPIDHADQDLAQQLLERRDTLASMDIAIKSPEGGWKLYKLDASGDAQQRQSSLVSDGTLMLEIGPESVKSLRLGGQEEFTLPWKEAAAWDGMLKPGEYQIAVRGTLKLSTRERTVRQRGKPEEKFPATETEIAFRTEPISIEVNRADMRTQTLEELAAAAIEAVKQRPEIKEEELEVIGSESIPIADGDGNRVIRVRANIPKPKPKPGPDGGLIIGPVIAGGTGYWQYEVAMSADGKPATIARWRKGFCVTRGTTISTPDGDIAVENIYAGQPVWAYDLQSNELVAASVLAVLSSRVEETITINGSLRVSHDHPVLTLNDSEQTWKRAAEVRKGEVLLHRDSEQVAVTSVEITGGEIEVFDIAVDGPHNFFAGGLLVHNKSIAWTPQAFVPWYALWNRAPVK